MTAHTTQRIHKYDNLKGFAIILIVLGHMLFLIQFPSVKFIRYFISIFHLPIFFFVSGYFSKIGPGEGKKAFKRLIIPYLVFCTVYTIFLYLIGWKIQPLFIYPTMALWFLTALFFMKICLPLMDRLKFPVLISVVLALLIGFVNIDPNILGITRFFAFYPVFLIGFYYKDYKSVLANRFTGLSKTLDKRHIAVLIGIATLAMCAVAAQHFPAKVIVMAECYGKPTEMIKRLIVLVLAITTTLVFHKLASNKEYFLTKIGRNSMAVYLLHPYFVSSIKKFLSPVLKKNIELYLIFSFVMTIIIVFILSRDIVTVYLNKMFDFIGNLIFREV